MEERVDNVVEYMRWVLWKSVDGRVLNSVCMPMLARWVGNECLLMSVEQGSCSVEGCVLLRRTCGTQLNPQPLTQRWRSVFHLMFSGVERPKRGRSPDDTPPGDDYNTKDSQLT